MHEKRELKQRVQSNLVCYALGRANTSHLRGCMQEALDAGSSDMQPRSLPQQTVVMHTGLLGAALHVCRSVCENSEYIFTPCMYLRCNRACTLGSAPSQTSNIGCKLRMAVCANKT